MLSSKHIALPILGILFSNAIFAQTLDGLLQAAYRQHPELKALHLEYEAALQKAPQVSQLPDPQVNMAIPILRPETRLGGQVITVGASQMFPWFGTLKAKKNVVLSMAKEKYERIATARLNITYRVKEAYYQLHLLNEKQRIVNENIRLFNTLEKVALAKVESGKTSAADALRIRLKIQELQQQLPILDAEKQRHYAQINELTGKPLNNVVELVNAPNDIALLEYDLNAYAERIRHNHPLVRQLDLQIETSERELDLNALQGKPSLGIGLDYGIVTKRSDANPVNNGRDLLIPKAMVKLPIYRKKYGAKRKEEALKQSAFEMRKKDLENSLLSLIQNHKTEYDQALLTIDLMERQIKVSQSVYDILLAEYSAKGNRFDELMQTQGEMLKYELNIIMAQVKTHLIKVKIEQLTGVDNDYGSR